MSKGFPVEALNLLAMHADAEARSTAQLVEMVAAACVYKLKPPQGEEVVSLTISQADLQAAMAEHTYHAEYDEHGTMTLHLTAIVR